MRRPIDDGARERIARQLVESVDRLQKEVEKVEFWATAVTAFTQPIPDYEPGSPNAFRHVRPAGPPKKVRKTNAKKNAKTHEKTKKGSASAEPV
jgi:hypothetical protein